MNNLLIIDSDILIDVARKDKTAIERLEEERKKSISAISSVTQMELIVGCRNKTELKHLDEFLEDFEIINLNYVITQKAIELLKEYRLSHGLLIADSIIAATSLILDVSLLSKNQKDFKFIKGLRLIKYP
ncbi:MAG: type II toxin-antitoxin system VapC family toxin [Bacteroidetes bacterium]|nr:type II toxin-antitoxin system VapC family toxin [Bacteroidota bacterium]MBU1678239.1 type II toxin-antitoxin system VapC family toxin [Bacteroidota bacterium]MBU2506924.1 type II toxin-antitoxin system VapC family toxin [Bacteroidota bacterium]